MEVIVGDIEDEYDEEEDEIQVISPNEFLVDGSTKISDVNEILNIELESEEFDSIGGYIIGYIRHIPEALPLTGIDITFRLSDEPCMVEIQAAVTCTGVTGVEMEALTAVSVAALTVYDMCKAVQKDMEITNIRLLEKSGGKSGDYKRED